MQIKDIKLYKTDIYKIGHTMYVGEDGYLRIIAEGMTANIEEILLRNILLLFGEYSITETTDHEWGVEFITNYKGYPDCL